MLLLLRGEKRGMRRNYFRSGPLLDRASSGQYGATSGCACAEHTSGQGHVTDVTWLTSLSVMCNGPIHRTIHLKCGLSCTHILLYNILKFAELDCCQIIILSIYIYTIYTRLDTCLMSISRFSLRDKVTLRLLKLHFYGADVVEWSRALDIRLTDWCCTSEN